VAKADLRHRRFAFLIWPQSVVTNQQVPLCLRIFSLGEQRDTILELVDEAKSICGLVLRSEGQAVAEAGLSLGIFSLDGAARHSESASGLGWFDEPAEFLAFGQDRQVRVLLGVLARAGFLEETLLLGRLQPSQGI
jgi:hypothetical protein